MSALFSSGKAHVILVEQSESDVTQNFTVELAAQDFQRIPTVPKITDAVQLTRFTGSINRAPGDKQVQFVMRSIVPIEEDIVTRALELLKAPDDGPQILDPGKAIKMTMQLTSFYIAPSGAECILQEEESENAILEHNPLIESIVTSLATWLFLSSKKIPFPKFPPELGFVRAFLVQRIQDYCIQDYASTQQRIANNRKMLARYESVVTQLDAVACATGTEHSSLRVIETLKEFDRSVDEERADSTLRFRNRRLFQIPPRFYDMDTQRVRILELSELCLQHVLPALRRFVYLTRIDLSSNAIAHLEGNIFAEMQQLLDLDLSSNRLCALDDWKLPESLVKANFSKNNIKTIEGESFCTTVNLVELNLGENRLVKLSGEFFPERQTSLKQLLLGKNQFRGIPECVARCWNLESLDMSGNMLHSFADSFCNVISQLERIKILNVNDNSISELPGEVFLHTSLERISFERNTLHHIYDCSGGATGSSIRIIRLGGNMLSTLPRHLFLASKNTLEQFHAEKNKLKALPPILGKSLKHLVLSENFIVAEDEQLEMHHPPLEHVDLSDNGLIRMPERIFAALIQNTTSERSERKMILSRNKIEQLPEDFFARYSVQGNGKILIDLEENALEKFPETLSYPQIRWNLDKSVRKRSGNKQQGTQLVSKSASSSSAQSSASSSSSDD